ncbi:MAG: protein kinase [Bacteroidales bacterium]
MSDSDKFNWERISDLYSMALEMPPESWHKWLQTQCNEQEKESGMDTYLLKLLKSSPRADAFFDALNRNIDDDFARQKDMDEYQPGDLFDKFRIMKEIGRGGMSKVFLCQRADGQFDQKVAVKVMKVRGNTEFMKDRFRREQQILAGINHAHIAQLYDGGITEQGHPYIIMEYVEGEAIDSYCKKNNLGIKDMLRLYTQVCDALQYAHSKLIVHHDIKPANIMVNKSGNVKLLDFGISQVLFSQEKEETKSTAFEGTLQYASPEQFHGAGPSVASDIYKLGLVLYNLLTGKLYNFKQENPNFRNDIFQSRQNASGSAAKKNSLLFEDLDAILHKCLAKEPSERFESVGALSHDLHNTLNNRILHSHPADLGYRLRKSYARNKIKVWMFTLFNIALLISLAFLISQFRKTFQEKERAEHILAFVLDVFESADPEMARGDTLTVYELLENSLPRIESLDEQPELQVELYYLTGRIYSKMGFWHKGKDLFFDALSKQNLVAENKKNEINKALILTHLAGYFRNNSEYEKADSIIDIAIEMYEKMGSHEDIEKFAEALNTKARIKTNMAQYDECIKNAEKAFDMLDKQIDGPHIEKVRAKINMAYALNYLSRYDEGIELVLEALSMGDKLGSDVNSTIIMGKGLYSTLLSKKGEIEKALEIDHEIYRLKKKIYGEDKPSTLVTLSNMAGKYYQLKEYKISDSLNQIALAYYLEIFDENHNNVSSTLLNLGNSAYHQRNFSLAREYLTRSLELDIRNLGESHPFLADTYQTLGLIDFYAQQYDKAEEKYFTALKILQKNYGNEHHYISKVLRFIADLYGQQGKYSLCKEYFDNALAMSINILGEDHPDTQRIKKNMDEFADKLTLVE